jgi:hypothetical protein
LWRDDDLNRHPKGSCAGCHGADFFDLARIGSTDTDMLRRAKIDGATEPQAQALVAAVKEARLAFNMPQTNAREFRPFQPGGSVLLPDNTDAPHVRAVMRDIAFGNQLRPLLPTLFGNRIDSLSAARQARDEMLDLANGTNTAGANPKLLNLRSLPTGIQYPLWSADLHHGAGEGSINDWIADVAHDPKPERKSEWHALQNAYLADPSTENFWRMYNAVEPLTQTQLLGACSLLSNSCYGAKQLTLRKFRASLIGQHLMRQQLAGRADFLSGALAFSYLDTDPRFAFMLANPDPEYLPSDMWHVGDDTRTMLDDSEATGSLRDTLGKLGFPAFVQDSIDPLRSEAVEQHAVRLAWFWIGFTFDPSFKRIFRSNSTLSAEYLIGSLLEDRMFAHDSFMAHMRLAVKGTLPQANKKSDGKNKLYALPTYYLMDYSYFWGYNRTVLKWNESAKNKITFDQSLKDQAAEQWARLTGNGFRMSIWLQMEALDQEPLKSDAKQRAAVQAIATGGVGPMRAHFDAYHAATRAADEALLQALADKAGVPLPAP